MAQLKSVIAKLEDVAENLRGFYSLNESDGKYYLDSDIWEEHRGLIQNRDEIKREKQQLQAKLEKFRNLDPEEAQKAMDRIAELDRQESERKGEFEKLKAQLIDNHKKELDRVTKERDTLRTRLIDREKQKLVNDALDPLKGNARLLYPHMAGQMKLEPAEDGADFNVSVIDERGQVRLSTDPARVGQPMTVAELAKEMSGKPEYAGGFAGSGGSGGGAPPTSRGGAPVTITKRSELVDDKAKSQFIEDHGLEAFQQLAP